jgi:basic amino acid/polyamine antiporter, APA family
LLPVDLLGNLTSIGTLFAFFLVSISTAVLRYTDPDLPRQFRIPGPEWLSGKVIPGLSAAASLGLMFSATTSAVLRVFIWLVLGLVIYASFGYWHSRVGSSNAEKIELQVTLTELPENIKENEKPQAKEIA